VGINYEPKWQRYLTPMEITWNFQVWR
jgi:hypothetical protein